MLPLPSICAPEKKKTSMRPWPALSKSSRPPSVQRLCSGLCCSETLGPSGESSCARKAAAAGIGELAPTATWRAAVMRRSTTSISTSSSLMPLISGGAAGKDMGIEVTAEAFLAGGEPDVVEEVLRVLAVEIAHLERPGAARGRCHRLDVEGRNGRGRRHFVGQQVALVQRFDRDDAQRGGVGEGEEVPPAADPDIAVAVGKRRVKERH